MAKVAKVEKKALRTWSSKQAVAILAVDNIKLSEFGVDLLKRKEEGASFPTIKLVRRLETVRGLWQPRRSLRFLFR